MKKPTFILRYYKVHLACWVNSDKLPHTMHIMTEGGHRGCDHMVVGYTKKLFNYLCNLPITTDVVGSTSAQGEVYNIIW